MRTLTVDGDLHAGERALQVEGCLQEAREHFDRAYHQAEKTQDSEGMARAALGLGGLWVHEHRTAAAAVTVDRRLQDALRTTDQGSALNLRLRLRLAAELDYQSGGHATILALLAEARQAGDPVPLAEALSLAHHCVLGPGHGALRIELARDLIGEASRTGRRSDLLMGLLWHTVDLLMNGAPHAGRCLEELRAELARADHMAVGFVLDAIEVMLCIRAGRFDEAEKLAEICAERGTAAGDLDATGWYGSQLGTIRWYQGRLAELLPVISDLADSPSLSAVDNSSIAGLALAAATAGDRWQATGALARLCGHDLAVLPRSSTWLMSMYAAVEAAYLLTHTEIAAQAYELLTPFARLPVIISLGVSCLGSVQHCLGVASMTMNEPDRAVRHLRLAVRDNLALGHRPAVVLSRFRLGQALAQLSGSNDGEVHDQLTLAAQDAEELGMALPTGIALPSHMGGVRSRPGVSCQRRGTSWRIGFGERSVLVRDSVGVRHLAALLANPGQEIKSADLVTGLALFDEGPVSAQSLLDETAETQYRKRLSELAADIEEAEAMNDLERASAIRAEQDWLLDELASAAGLAGRSRQFSDNRERARIAVGKAIRRAVKRISEADSVIGAELQATIHTGLRCCYRPD